MGCRLDVFYRWISIGPSSYCQFCIPICVKKNA